EPGSREGDSGGRRRPGRARSGGAARARRPPRHAPRSGGTPGGEEPADRGRGAADGYRPLPGHLPGRLGGTAPALGRPRGRERGRGGGGRGAPAAASPGGRTLLLPGRGMLAAGREGASVAGCVGEVRGAPRGPRAGGDEPPHRGSAGSWHAPRPPQAPARLRREAHDAELPRRLEVAPGWPARGDRHTHAQRGRRAQPDARALREHAGGHGSRRGLGAGGRRLRDTPRPREPRPGGGRGAADGRARRSHLQGPRRNHERRRVRGGRRRERAGRGGAEGEAGAAREEGASEEALVLGRGDLRGAGGKSAGGRRDARGSAAPGPEGPVPEPGGRGGAGRDDGVRELLPAGRGVPERRRDAGAAAHRAAKRPGVRAGEPVREEGARTPGTRDLPSKADHGVPGRARDPAPPLLRGMGGAGRGALRGGQAVLEERPVPQPSLQRPRASVAVAGRGVGPSGRRYPRGARGGHDLHLPAPPDAGAAGAPV
ncbi:MAG: Phytoene dehydrogenase and related proteins, partial [uncultured Rubrobacteraceae bacterium]